MKAKGFMYKINIDELSDENMQIYLNKLIEAYEKNYDGIFIEYNILLRDKNDILHQFINSVSQNVYLPLTFKGDFTSSDDVGRILSMGIDKIVIDINKIDTDNKIIEESICKYGCHCVSIFHNLKNDVNSKLVSYVNSDIGGIFIKLGCYDSITEIYKLLKKSKVNISAIFDCNYDKESVLSLCQCFDNFAFEESVFNINDIKSVLKNNNYNVRL